MLERLTGIDVKKDIPSKDPDVISLFSSTKALNIKPEDIGGEKTGLMEFLNLELILLEEC
ncbi:hypothetical protein NWP96_07220 [Mycoplasmopsis cynos]|nr:hypothetical protein [Mycoplasmopsis cynos]